VEVLLLKFLGIVEAGVTFSHDRTMFDFYMEKKLESFAVYISLYKRKRNKMNK